MFINLYPLNPQSAGLAYKRCDEKTKEYGTSDFRNCVSKVHKEIMIIQEKVLGGLVVCITLIKCCWADKQTKANKIPGKPQPVLPLMLGLSDQSYRKCRRTKTVS